MLPDNQNVNVSVWRKVHIEFLVPIEFLLCREEKLETEVRPLCSQAIYVSVLDKCSISLAVIVKGMSVSGAGKSARVVFPHSYLSLQ